MCGYLFFKGYNILYNFHADSEFQSLVDRVLQHKDYVWIVLKR